MKKSRDETPEQAAARKEEAAIDHALVKRAQTGDEDAFARLVDRHQRRAYRVARNLVPTDEDAQDLAQEAFLRVFRHLERFDFGHDFTTWLYRIVTNLCIDFLRKRRSSYSVSGGIGDDDGPLELEDEGQAAPSDHAEAMETAAIGQVFLFAGLGSMLAHLSITIYLSGRTWRHRAVQVRRRHLLAYSPTSSLLTSRSHPAPWRAKSVCPGDESARRPASPS